MGEWNTYTLWPPCWAFSSSLALGNEGARKKGTGMWMKHGWIGWLVGLLVREVQQISYSPFSRSARQQQQLEGVGNEE